MLSSVPNMCQPTGFTEMCLKFNAVTALTLGIMLGGLETASSETMASPLNPRHLSFEKFIPQGVYGYSTEWCGELKENDDNLDYATFVRDNSISSFEGGHCDISEYKIEESKLFGVWSCVDEGIEFGGDFLISKMGDHYLLNQEIELFKCDIEYNFTDPPPVMQYIVQADTVLNARSGPGTHYDVIGRLPRGTLVTEVFSDGKWVQVVAPDFGSVWLHSDFLVAVGKTGSDHNRSTESLSRSPATTEAQPRNEGAVTEQAEGESSDDAYDFDELGYGTRAGMIVTIKVRRGIDTSDAEIVFETTRQDAAQFCAQSLNTTMECINRVLEENRRRLVGSIGANCKTDRWSDVYGQKFRYLGPGKSGDSAEYVIVNLDTNEILDGSSASGFLPTVEAFRKLCPTRYSEW